MLLFLSFHFDLTKVSVWLEQQAQPKKVTHKGHNATEDSVCVHIFTSKEHTYLSISNVILTFSFPLFHHSSNKFNLSGVSIGLLNAVYVLGMLLGSYI